MDSYKYVNKLYKKILPMNLLIHIYLHCVRRVSSSGTILDTLTCISTTGFLVKWHLFTIEIQICNFIYVQSFLNWCKDNTLRVFMSLPQLRYTVILQDFISCWKMYLSFESWIHEYSKKESVQDLSFRLRIQKGEDVYQCHSLINPIFKGVDFAQWSKLDMQSVGHAISWTCNLKCKSGTISTIFI